MPHAPIVLLYDDLSVCQGNLGVGLGSEDSSQRESRLVSVGLEKWHAHVGMAHHNVHAGAHGALFRLGNPPAGKERVALAGPSLYGQADPGHACAISLQQLTLQVVLQRAEDDARDPH